MEEEARSLLEEARTLQGHTFLSPEEKAKLMRLANKAGLSQSAYLRMLINQQQEEIAVAS